MFAASDTETRWISNAATALLAAAAAIAAMALDMSRAQADDLIVKYDQSQLLRLPRPVSEIIIGNSMIADVTIQASNLLVVTGKSFGITNIISLDADRNIIQDQRIIVQRDEIKVVNLHKATKRESYNCSPQCNPMITIGDDKEYFQSTAASSERKIRLSEGNSDGPSGGSGGGQ